MCGQTGQTEIQNWIEKNMPGIVEDLKRICRIRSVADLETKATEEMPYGKGCRDVLQEMLLLGEENGFQTHNFENYVGRITYPGKTEKNIGVWAHLDVVEEGKDWQYAPYEPIVKNQYFIARGCQDNKSSAIIGLYALKYLKEHGIVPEYTMELYLGTCEEQGMYDIDYFLEHYKAPGLSLIPDSGFPVCMGERGSFNGELRCDEACGPEILEVKCDCDLYTVPDRAQLCVAYSGEIWEKCKDAVMCEDGKTGVFAQKDEENKRILLTAAGISTQASNPKKGKNAWSLMADFICQRKLFGEAEQRTFSLIKDMNADYCGTALGAACQDEWSGPTVMTATRLRMCEGHFVIDFISKYPITKNEYPFEKNALDEACRRGFTLHTTRLSKANYFEPDRPEVQILTEISNQVLERDDAPFVMSGGTYARKLPDALAFGTGMPLPERPADIFKPGHGDYHQPDESIALERIQKGLEIYIRGLLELNDRKCLS